MGNDPRKLRSGAEEDLVLCTPMEGGNIVCSPPARLEKLLETEVQEGGTALSVWIGDQRFSVPYIAEMLCYCIASNRRGKTV